VGYGMSWHVMACHGFTHYAGTASMLKTQAVEAYPKLTSSQGAPGAPTALLYGTG